jgi:hypothetical protein
MDDPLAKLVTDAYFDAKRRRGSAGQRRARPINFEMNTDFLLR